MPGNHDVNRTKVNSLIHEGFNEIYKSKGSDIVSHLTELIHEKGIPWKDFMERLSDYSAFLRENGFEHLLQDPQRLIYSIEREIHGIKVGIAGLNSAWSSYQDNEKGKLYLAGHYQIQSLLKRINTSEIKISLMHHPINWFVSAEDPDVQREIENNFDFFLHGHEHQDWVDEKASGFISISAGASYCESGEESGYNVVKLDLDSGRGEIWLRTFDKTGEGWIPKIVHNKTDTSGIWEFTISQGLIKGTKSDIAVAENYYCDVPPNNPAWVGRKKELTNIASSNFKVIFITGIGGQGKSGLAAHYVRNVIDKSNDWEYWDWRDCKEEDYRLHTKLIAIIERLTNGAVKQSQLAEENIDSLIDTFFKHLGSRKIVFVFDNIDRYIDLKYFVPNRAIGILFNNALQRNHSSKFIFTCRPFIRHAAVDFYQITLGGLSLEETSDLLGYYKIPLEKNEFDELATNAHELTKGHPLWINLIGAQATRGKDNVARFIEGIKNISTFKEEDFSSILSWNILKTVWETLNTNQKVLLRAMAETVRAETEDNLRSILENLLTANRFTKSLRVLKSLNLIVIKSMPNEHDLLELHPLVKEYLKQKYPLVERSRYITLFVRFYEKMICAMKPGLSSKSSSMLFEKWIDKIELEINNEDYESALSSLNELHIPLLSAGYKEEFIRISHLLFINLDWVKATTEEYAHFHSVLKTFTDNLVELGRFDDAESFLIKYGKLISERDSFYVSYCYMMCYFYWFKEDFDDAVTWGEKGFNLAKTTESNAPIYAPNRLALAWRDSRLDANIDKALNSFLEGEKLDDVLTGVLDRETFDGSYFGNIGRCLWYKGDDDAALLCYKKSYQRLHGEDSENTLINIGYANYWIAEVLLKRNDNANAYYFLKNAYSFWNKISPPRAHKVEAEITQLINADASIRELSLLSDQDIEKYCIRWIGNDER